MPHKKSKPQLPKRLVEHYRAIATRPGITDTITTLNMISTHHEHLDLTLGRPDVARGAENLWLTLAIRLGASPAATVEEAHDKVFYLNACLDAWVMPNAKMHDHMQSTGLIAGAVYAEEERWGFPIGDGKAN